MWHSNSISRYISKRFESRCSKKTCTQRFIAALFTIAKRWKYPLTDEWINKMWYIHTTIYYSVIKRNEVLIHAPTWINLENIMLSKRSLTQKAKYCIIPFIWNIQNKQIHKDRNQISDWQGLGTEGNEEWLFNGNSVSFWGD